MNNPSSASLHETLKSHLGEVVLHICGCYEDFQFWLTPFSALELEEWWREQGLFNRFSNESHEELCRIFGVEEEPPPRREEPLPGVFFDADYPAGTSLWDELASSGRHYQCVICCETDSYLQRPDKTRIYHRGYNGSRA